MSIFSFYKSRAYLLLVSGTLLLSSVATIAKAWLTNSKVDRQNLLMYCLVLVGSVARIFSQA